MKLSDYVIEFLKAENIHHVFLYPGGAITHLMDSLYKTPDIKAVVVHHEQAGAFAAEAYARVTGNLGIAMATSGPGATNMITGIGSAFFDSIPCLYLTGQVNSYEYKWDKPIRQIGFQETDIVSIVKPITKDAFMITDPEKIKFLLQKALYTAKSGRPGPVLIDLPMDIQRAEINPDKLEAFSAADNSLAVDGNLIDEIAIKIQNSKRPVFLVGGGVRLAKAPAELLKLANQTKIPVVSSLMGLDALPHDHPGFCGMIGAYGNRFANFTIANSDLVITVGSRLTSRQTSTRPDTFARAAEIIQVDVDDSELYRDFVTLSVRCDAKVFLTELTQRLASYNPKVIQEWLQITQSYKINYPTYPSKSATDPCIDPNYFMEALSGMLNPEDVICLDVGQNQIWAAQSLRLKPNQRMLISGGMGAMGFALPAAVGAYLAASQASPETAPLKRVIAITGDGGIQMNIQELQTIVRNEIPVKIILMNNNCLGMIRHFQELYFEGRYHGTITGYDNPNFQGIADAYKINYFQIATTEQITGTLQEALESDGAALIEVNLPQYTYVIPKLEMGRPIEDQSPLLDREEFKSNMIIEPLDS
jgi:acetolactate synthase-1/2/3 large subunit